MRRENLRVPRFTSSKVNLKLPPGHDKTTNEEYWYNFDAQTWHCHKECIQILICAWINGWANNGEAGFTLFCFPYFASNVLCNFSATQQWAFDVTGNVHLLCDITMAPKRNRQMQKRSEWKETASFFTNKSVFAVLCVILFITAVRDSSKPGKRLTWEA